MKSKMFEVRDNATRIGVVAISTDPDSYQEFKFWFNDGYGPSDIILMRSHPEEANYDPFKWNSSTMREAHLYIREHFKELNNFSVVDVRSIRDPNVTPAASEIWE